MVRYHICSTSYAPSCQTVCNIHILISYTLSHIIYPYLSIGLFGTGAAIGALCAPLLFSSRGRKPTMCWGAIAFTIGAALQAAAVSMPMLYIPRLLSGFGIGMLSMCSPVYIAECAPESHRGQLSTIWQLSITTGIVLVSILNIWLADWDEGWRISYGGNIVFSVALLLLMTIMPESPHFLVRKERHDDARAALAKVRFEHQVSSCNCNIDCTLAKDISLIRRMS